MRVDGTHYRSIWFNHASGDVGIIDQRWLPSEFRIATLQTRAQFATAIRDMWVRGAPLIGATAAYGVAMEMAADSSDRALDDVWHMLNETRPTAINLRWALDRCRTHLAPMPPEARPARSLGGRAAPPAVTLRPLTLRSRVASILRSFAIRWRDSCRRCRATAAWAGAGDAGADAADDAGDATGADGRGRGDHVCQGRHQGVPRGRGGSPRPQVLHGGLRPRRRHPWRRLGLISGALGDSSAPFPGAHFWCSCRHGGPEESSKRPQESPKRGQKRPRRAPREPQVVPRRGS